MGLSPRIWSCWLDTHDSDGLTMVFCMAKLGYPHHHPLDIRCIPGTHGIHLLGLIINILHKNHRLSTSNRFFHCPLPSGYLLHSYGKSPLFKGKPSISMGHLYHGYVTNNQMVSSWFQHIHLIQNFKAPRLQIHHPVLLISSSPLTTSVVVRPWLDKTPCSGNVESMAWSHHHHPNNFYIL